MGVREGGRERRRKGEHKKNTEKKLDEEEVELSP